MNLEALRAKKATLWNQMKDFLASKTGTLTKAESEEYDRMESELNSISDSISRLERLEQVGNQMRQPIASPVLNNPANGEAESGRDVSDEYKRAFVAGLRNGFKFVSDELKTSVDEDGGFLVPDELDSRIIMAAETTNIMRKLSTVIKTSGQRKITVAGDDADAAWTDEGETLTFSNPKFGSVVLDAHKITAGVKATTELMEDSAFDIANYVTASLGRSAGKKEETAFMVGDGVGKPTGIFNAAAGGMASATAALTPESLIALVYDLDEGYRENAVFVMNKKNVAAIMSMRDADGNLLWNRSLAEGQPDTLLGHKVYTSPYAPEDKIAFGDLKYYNIGDRGRRTISTLREVFATEGKVGFILNARVDGKLTRREAVKILTVTP